MKSDLTRYAAANARLRCFLPSLLGRSGLDALYATPSFEALRESLARTVYGAVMTVGVPLDGAVRQRIAIVGRALLAMLADPERSFILVFLLRHEVEILKLVVRAIHHHVAWQSVAPYVFPLPGIGTIDAASLAQTPDVPALADRLAGTPYEAAVRDARHRLAAAGPFAVEVALELDYYERLWAHAGRLCGMDAVLARQLLGQLFDLLNINWIVRYREVLGLSPEETLNYTLREGRWLSTALRLRLAEDPQRLESVLARTPYARLLHPGEGRDFNAFSAALWRLLAQAAQRAMGGDPFHIAGPLAFLLTLEIEVRDLRILLAAKQLAVPAGEVAAQLATVRT